MAEPLSPVKRALLALDQLQRKLDALQGQRTEPIAIVGMGCRFPGGADSPELFWERLREGFDAVREIGRTRWDHPALYDADPGAPGRIATRWGAFLDRVDEFDAEFFGMSPREAAHVDPQQRLLLEVAWEALEDAAIPPDRLAGSATGVYAGVIDHDYAFLQYDDPSRIDAWSGTGVSNAVAAGRLSYLLDLRGPSLAVDTACSSSLVAVHLACLALRSGECDLAIAGGVHLVTSPLTLMPYTKMRLLSPEGRCKAFDASANGIAPGEGAGLVVLERLSDALAARRRIRALVRGSAANQDGRSNGLTAPSGESQRRVLVRALENAGVSAREIGYVEAHGTGTPLGDPIELEALSEVLGEGPPCPVGSVKTNVGHLGGAAGVAGMAKAVLALEKGEIPPHLHFHELNPHVSLAGSRLIIPAALVPWPRGDSPRRAGVSSFGWSGTNVHVVLEEAPAAAPAPPDEPPRVGLLPFSARSEEALRELAGRYASRVAEPAVELCRAAAFHRSHLELRAALLVRSVGEAAADLAAFARGERPANLVTGPRAVSGRPALAFVFSGQGAQWKGMGRALLDEPAFGRALGEADRVVRAEAGWSVLDELSGDRLGRTEVAQPVLVALQLALTALWRDWGVEPDLAIGHSVGELAAAATAGALDFEAALRLAVVRGRVLEKAAGRGRMVALDLAPGDAARLVAGREDSLAIAAVNGPRSVVLAGDREALEDALRGIPSRDLGVDYPFHSPAVRSLGPELAAAIRDLSPGATTIPLLSTVTGRAIPGTELGRAYWERNLAETVRFAPAVERAMAEGTALFLELGPHPVLGRAIEDAGGLAAASLRRGRDDRESMLRAAALLHVAGRPLDWERLQGRPARPVSLPGYPWQRRRHWVEPARHRAAEEPGSHPLLGGRLSSPLAAAIHESRLGSERPAWLADHRLHGHAVLPATAFLEMARAALGARSRLESVVLRQALVLSQEPRAVQLVLEGDRFGVHSLAPGGSWILHAEGSLRAAPAPGPASEPVEAIRARCPEEIETSAFYGRLAAMGYAFGQRFRTLDSIRRGSGEALGLVGLHPSLLAEAAACPVHPTILDGAEQVVVACLPEVPGGDSFVPLGFDAVHWTGRSATRLWSHARLREGTRELAIADLEVMDEAGELVVRIEGLRLKRSRPEALHALEGGLPSRWLHEVVWRERQAAPANGPPGRWAIVGDPGGLAGALARAGADVVEPGSAGPLRGVVALGGPPSVLASLRALSSKGGTRLWIVTRGASAATAAEPPDPDAATLWGLGRSIAAERPELWGGLVDLDPAHPDLERLASILLEPGGEDAFALRGGRTLVPRLVPAAGGWGAPPAPLPAEGTWLVTGGWGGLGLAVAGRLVARGARSLLLLGRSAPSSEAKAAILRLEAAGARVAVRSGDVSRADELERVLAAARRELPPISAVVHAAGVLDDGLATALDEARLAAVLAPKLRGAENLDRRTRGDPIERFVLFGSGVALLGSPGQAAYAAANAGLAALAERRRAEGLPAVAIHWGPWAGAGMAARLGERWRERWAARGLGSLPVEAGLDAFERLADGRRANPLVASIDWPRWLESAAGPVPPLLAELAPAGGPRAGLVLPREPAERKAFLVAHLALEVVRVLSLDPSRPLDPRRGLSELGMDSLMALELRTSLELSLGRPLPSTLAFEHPTVEALASFLAGEAPRAASHALESMSDEEAERLFAKRLGRERS